MNCTSKHGVAQLGDYANVATVTGSGEGSGIPVADDDPSHYHGVEKPEPEIDIEKATNGHDADDAPGVELFEGDAVTWTYVVTNVGTETVVDISVLDDQEGVVTCPKSELAPGEAMSCTSKHGVAQLGQYENTATVTGSGEGSGKSVSDDDPSHYFGNPTDGGSEGCTPGYWKNHPDSWPPTGYATGQSVQSVFASAAAYPAIGSASLIEALDFNGGSGVEGAARNLLRAGVAGLLDASHSGVDYPRNPADVIADVDAALASGDRNTMLTLASAIDSDNNLGCPLN